MADYVGASRRIRGREIRGLRHQIAASLRLRVLVLVVLGFAVVAVPAYMAFTSIVNSTVIKLGTLFAEKQILYDRYRGLEALMSEVSLAETLAGTQSIRDWAVAETDPVKQQRGIAELEHYRQFFTDHSYFFVIGASGNYYFNDAANSYAGEQFRYTLDPKNPRDGWYYNTAALGQGCHLNVDNDDNLHVTKVWMNCVIREGNRVLGILGTGIDLTSFIREVVNVPQVGVTSIFVDRSGAVQAHRDRNLVDYHSLTKDVGDKKTVFSMLDKAEDRVGAAGADGRGGERAGAGQIALHADRRQGRAGRRRLSRQAGLVQCVADGRQCHHRSQPVPAHRPAAGGDDGAGGHRHGHGVPPPGAGPHRAAGSGGACCRSPAISPPPARWSTPARTKSGGCRWPLPTWPAPWATIPSSWKRGCASAPRSWSNWPSATR